MNPITLKPTSVSLAALAVSALLSACGGGDGPPSAITTAASDIADVSGRAKALGLTVDTVDAKALFDWAQYKYPELFVNGVDLPGTIPYEGKTFQVRAFASSRYLGLADTGDVYGLGDFTDNALRSFGNKSLYAASVVADQCNVYPGSPGCVATPPPSGPLNECTDPALSTLPTGFTLSLVYDYSGSLTGEQRVESRIEGPASFEGQSAVKITTTTAGSNTVEGYAVSLSSTTQSFQQAAGNGLVKTLGALADSSTSGITVGGITIGGTQSSSKIVYAPPLDNREFFLQKGQTSTQTNLVTTTTSTPAGVPSSSVNVTHTVTFADKDPALQVFGKTYNTCRYTMTDPTGGITTIWYLVGKGVPVKTVSTGSDGTLTVQLKSGLYNGAPL